MLIRPSCVRSALCAVVAAAAAAGCADAPSIPQHQQTWQLRADGSYVNLGTMQRFTPDELYAHGVGLHKAKRHEEAAAAFGALAESAPDDALRARASFSRAETVASAGAFADAYRLYDAYQARHPDGEHATLAKERMMQCALELARVGQRESVLGIPILKTATAGVELLKSTLQRFPREDFSDDYHYKLAEFHHGRGEFDEAELELRHILADPTYQRGNSAPHALLLLGRIGEQRYDGPDYDHKTLIDAKRAYERFIGDYKALPAPAAEAMGIKNLPAILADAQKRIAEVNSRLAEREYVLAEYYYGRGHPRSARVYLDYILKNYPDSKWAEDARGMLKELPPEDRTAP